MDSEGEEDDDAKFAEESAEIKNFTASSKDRIKGVILTIPNELAEFDEYNQQLAEGFTGTVKPKALTLFYSSTIQLAHQLHLQVVKLAVAYVSMIPPL